MPCLVESLDLIIYNLKSECGGVMAALDGGNEGQALERKDGGGWLTVVTGYDGQAPRRKDGGRWLTVTAAYLALLGFLMFQQYQIAQLQARPCTCPGNEGLHASPDAATQYKEVMRGSRGAVDKEVMRRTRRAVDDLRFYIESQETPHKVRHQGRGIKQPSPSDTGWPDAMLGDRPKRKKGGRKAKGGKTRHAKFTPATAIHLDAEQRSFITSEKAGRIKFWKVEPTSEKKSKKYMMFKEGGVTVRQPGLFYIYSQLMYYNSNNVNGHEIVIHKNNGEDESFVQCTESSHPINDALMAEDNSRYRTCHTGGAKYLQEGDEIYIKASHANRTLQFNTISCFWGVVKLA